MADKPDKSTFEKRLVYKRLGRHYIGDAIRSAHHKVKLSAAQYHKETKMLVTAPLRAKAIRKTIRNLQRNAIAGGLNGILLRQYNYVSNYNNEAVNKANNRKLVVAIVVVFLSVVISVIVGNSVLSVRCLLPNNYLVWEATRPLADCGYCANVTKPIILRNVSRRNFANYAYLSKPIIIKNAISHWRATYKLNFYTFKRLYENTVGSYESIDEGCQFLNFKTDLFTLKEVFDMPDARARNEPGQKPWYVGW
ncbi:hypothetical protein MSG28_001371 [Choristoneura fumiferana]|nr:hypothetical protein MSG28_001371 [Choristoneura fumiferana]